MTKATWFQQGDVTIQPASIPGGERKDAGKILAHGEVTGHAHRLTEASDSLLVEIDGQLYLSVGAGGARVEHEEHKAIDLPPGDYLIGKVREFDHFLEESRAVRD